MVWCPPFSQKTMLRIHCMQQWFSLSDLGMKEAFFDTPIYREFARLDAHGRLPDESTILRFRHRLDLTRQALSHKANRNRPTRRSPAAPATSFHFIEASCVDQQI